MGGICFGGVRRKNVSLRELLSVAQRRSHAGRRVDGDWYCSVLVLLYQYYWRHWQHLQYWQHWQTVWRQCCSRRRTLKSEACSPAEGEVLGRLLEVRQAFDATWHQNPQGFARGSALALRWHCVGTARSSFFEIAALAHPVSIGRAHEERRGGYLLHIAQSQGTADARH